MCSATVGGVVVLFVTTGMVQREIERERENRMRLEGIVWGMCFEWLLFIGLK